MYWEALRLIHMYSMPLHSSSVKVSCYISFFSFELRSVSKEC